MPAPLVQAARRLRRRLQSLTFTAPVTHVYNPLDYARAAHEQYLTRWGAAPKRVLFLGMNPGPWGMAQTGVPFGETAAVREFVGVTAKVGRPEPEHPKRPVEGFECAREEVSGARLWGWARDTFGTPERFFERFWVTNYCPLLFLEESGRNLTPDKIRVAERRPVLEPCDRALRRVGEILEVERVVGVGAWAEKVARRVFGTDGPRIGRVLHPSPASPAANRGWAEQARAELEAQGIDLP